MSLLQAATERTPTQSIGIVNLFTCERIHLFDTEQKSLYSVTPSTSKAVM